MFQLVLRAINAESMLRPLFKRLPNLLFLDVVLTEERPNMRALRRGKEEKGTATIVVRARTQNQARSHMSGVIHATGVGEEVLRYR